METNCPFCNAPTTREIIAKSEVGIAFYDGFPVSPGHMLITPYRHVSSYFDLSTEEQNALWALVNQCKDIVQAAYKPDGFNIGVNVNESAGQSIFHVHIHLIPRYSGDVPNPRGGVRGVIPSKQNY